MKKESALEAKYTDEEAKRVAATVSDEVRNALKPTPDNPIIPRHKVVVQTIIGEKAGQSLKIASKSLWHSEHDDSATCAYETVYVL